MAIINGTNASDPELEGTNLADQIFGLGGSDILIGFDGDDEVEGGKGADQLFGSLGFDTASYKGSQAGVTVVLSEPYVVGGDATGDTLFSIEGLRGSAHADILSGDDQRNVLRGEGGADSLNGAEGDDRLEGGGGNDRLFGGYGADELRGGAGTDLAYYGMSDAGVRIDLSTGKGLGGDAAGDRLFGVEGVEGSELNDRISGNAAANRLAGNTGADLLSGAGGADRFVYFDTSNSTGINTDSILDFSRTQGDRIDLAGIDANERIDANQAFRFIGDGEFTGIGQLRFLHGDGGTVIQANTTDAHPGPELSIVLTSLVSLQSGDFYL